MPLSAKMLDDEESRMRCPCCRYYSFKHDFCYYHAIYIGNQRDTCAHWDKDLPDVENQALMDKLTGKGE